ncbi:MAG TPA: hypothetical protein VKS78_00440 [Roseiarcus sp.]|nr:hypothetical protein [Roseiarcus sp.]
MIDPGERKEPPRRWIEGTTLWLAVVAVALAGFITVMRAKQYL